MYKYLQEDLEDLPKILNEIKQYGLDYLLELNDTPTSVKIPFQKSEAPNNTIGVGAIQALKHFDQQFRPIICAASGSRYLGFVMGGTTPAAIVGDWLTTVLDQNTQSIDAQGDISARIEWETIALLLDLFGLPSHFLGGFVTGATMSNFSCLAVARQWIGKGQGIDIARDGMVSNLKVCAATPHSSSVKSLAMLGFGSNNFIKIKTLDGNREAIDVADLENKILQFGNAPFVLISSAGTVNTVDFDDMQAIATLKEKYHFWWHIDAAFGAFAACLPEYAPLLTGWEYADSITIDCHKWLNVPYDSAIFLVQEKHKNLQVETFQNSNAPYLGDPLTNFSYLNFLPENSRRLRALPTWFTLRAYGKEGYRDIVENSIFLAKKLGNCIENSENFELLAPVRLNTVCFSLKYFKEKPEVVQSFLTNMNNNGKVFMTLTKYNNIVAIRAAFVNWRTTAADVEIVFEEMQKAYAKILP